jgi:hypothetical protein
MDEILLEARITRISDGEYDWDVVDHRYPPTKGSGTAIMMLSAMKSVQNTSE